jgi:hypothetical protein
MGQMTRIQFTAGSGSFSVALRSTLSYKICTRKIFTEDNEIKSGPGSSVSIATRYGLDGPGIEYR